MSQDVWKPSAWHTVKCPLGACYFVVQAFQGLAQDQDKGASLLPPPPFQVLDNFLSISNFQEALLEEVEYSLHPKPRVKT